MKKISSFTILIILTAALLYGITQVVNKFNLSNVEADPLTYILLLTFFELLFLFIFGFFEKNRFRELFSLSRRNILDLLLIGVLVSGIAATIRMFGLVGSSATNSGIFQGMSVLSTVVFSYFLLGERLSKKSILLIITIIFGAFLLSTNGRFILPNTADLLLIFSLTIPGFTNTYAKGLMNKLSAHTVSIGRVFFGFLFILVIGLIFGVNFNVSEWELLLIAGAGFILASRIRVFYESIHQTNASYGATFLLLGGLLTPVIAYFTLGETLSLIQICGAILIIGGAYLLIKK